MNKGKSYIHILSLLLIFICLCFEPIIVKANSTVSIDSIEEQQIYSVINTYFDIRYQSLKNLKLNDFSSLIINSRDDSDMQKELDKLSLDVYHASIFHLRYQDYKYYLDVDNIKIDPTTNTALVDVIEGCDVVFEISAPTVSKIRNINHIISLQKVNGEWKIESDNYEDYLWRILKITKSSTSDLHNGITKAGQQWAVELANMQANPIIDLPNIPSPAYNTKAYNGLGASNYAATYWYSYNPDYFDFGGVDCTNFVSQAMYLGGGANMNYSYWYYTDVNHRGPAWAGVPQLYDFLYRYKSNYSVGPEGILTTASALYFGDIIQYDWTNNNSLDHSVIVTGVQSNGIPEVASHDPDMLLVPYTYNIYYFPDETYKFIHITDVKYYEDFTGA